MNNSSATKRRLAILGSTGSIGTQALDVVRRHRDLFSIELLTANNNTDLLIQQAKEFEPSAVVICNPDRYHEVADALQPLYIKVFAGMESVCDLVAADNVDMVLTAMVGFSGLESTVAAIRAGKAIALANKETLVAAGGIIMPLARESGSPILPVDSEHSAIFQCLQGERIRPVKLILTGSGGPFRQFTAEQLHEVTVDAALKHPRWKMGAKVTIDSASLMNKGLELIEARWLFDMAPEDIEVLIHPESVIHSMVRFADGSVMAQMAAPDMRLPIQYALSYPLRQELDVERIDFVKMGALHFEQPDTDRFPCLAIARDCVSRGGTACCTMNAGNEIAVSAFLEGRIRFTDIPTIVSETLAAAPFIEKPSLDDVFSTNFEARRIAETILKKLFN